MRVAFETKEHFGYEFGVLHNEHDSSKAKLLFYFVPALNYRVKLIRNHFKFILFMTVSDTSYSSPSIPGTKMAPNHENRPFQPRNYVYSY